MNIFLRLLDPDPHYTIHAAGIIIVSEKPVVDEIIISFIPAPKKLLTIAQQKSVHTLIERLIEEKGSLTLDMTLIPSEYNPTLDRWIKGLKEKFEI